MPDLSPGAELIKERVIYFPVGLFATDSGGVIAPSSYDWPKRHDAMRLLCRFLVDDDCPHP
jgi:hypothetical protein